MDIYDPDLYIEAPPHGVFERLRRECPVYWQEMRGEPGYWAVLKHADVVAVGSEPVLFSAATGGVVLEDLEPPRLEMMRRMLLSMDPPHHIQYRRTISYSFTPKMVMALEPRIREITRDIVRRAAEEREVDFVHDVAGPLPTQVIGELVGVPEADRAQIQVWAEQSTSGQDPELAGRREADGSSQMAIYGMGLAAQRRGSEGSDLASVILRSEVDGQRMSDLEFGSFFTQLVTAGNDTTKTMLASGMLALLDHPEQLAALREDPGGIPRALEEMLRWANPLHYFRRTATADTEIRGQKIRAGEKVAMMYTSANRDEEVFANPHRFDIRRDPNPHLSFGFGEHFCLGAKLARLEGQIFFEEVLGAFSRIELTGKPRRTRSNLNNALKELPVRLEAR